MTIVSRSWRNSGCGWCSENSSASWTQFHLCNEGAQPSGIGSCFRRRACKGAEMRSSLAMLFYIDYKCSTQPGFRKTFLVLLLIFAFLVWSPWRPLLCPVFGVCSAPAVRGDSAPQPQSKPRREKRATRLAPTSDPVERSTKPSLQAEFQQ